MIRRARGHVSDAPYNISISSGFAATFRALSMCTLQIVIRPAAAGFLHPFTRPIKLNTTRGIRDGQRHFRRAPCAPA